MLVLRGTVVTMRPPAVPARGEVYVGDDGLIAAVTPGDPVPPGSRPPRGSPPAG